MEILTNDTLYASIGERIVLPCRLEYAASKLRWRRGGILAQGLQFNPEFKGHERFKLSGGLDYDLTLLRVTETDFGEYSCEIQLTNGVSKGRVLLREKGMC